MMTHPRSAFPLIFFAILIFVCALQSKAAWAAAPNIVVTIKPVHSLVSAVTVGVTEPVLLLEGNSSPHNVQLKPSAFRALREADVMIWVGHGVEGFMSRVVDMLDDSVMVIELYDEPQLTLLSNRFSVDAHAGEHSDHTDDHSLNHEASHEGNIDGHLWLDPTNALQLVHSFAAHLGQIDPENRARYTLNAKNYQQKLSQLSSSIKRELGDVKDVPFVVFHDSFQYFEKRFGLSGVGVVAHQPEVQPGAKGLQQTLDTIKTRNVKCLFSEPQFPSRSVQMLVDQTAVRHAQLDPLGASYEKGSQMYLSWMADTARLVNECLSE